MMFLKWKRNQKLNSFFVPSLALSLPSFISSFVPFIKSVYFDEFITTDPWLEKLICEIHGWFNTQLGKWFTLMSYLVFYSYSQLLVYSFIMSLGCRGAGPWGEARECRPSEVGQLDVAWEAEGD